MMTQLHWQTEEYGIQNTEFRSAPPPHLPGQVSSILKVVFCSSVQVFLPAFQVYDSCPIQTIAQLPRLPPRELHTSPPWELLQRKSPVGWSKVFQSTSFHSPISRDSALAKPSDIILVIPWPELENLITTDVYFLNPLPLAISQIPDALRPQLLYYTYTQQIFLL